MLKQLQTHFKQNMKKVWEPVSAPLHPLIIPPANQRPLKYHSFQRFCCRYKMFLLPTHTISWSNQC